MGFRFDEEDNTNFTNPKEMYKDYKNRTINGLLDYQTDMIDIYMKNAFNDPDVAFELPTGSGKTLVGLVIGEYRRRKNKEKVVYLCPNNQLVYQVAEQANKQYGIKVNTFTKAFSEYSPKSKTEFLTCEAIAITNYSSFFNKSTFFDDVDILIFDDAHSSEDYIVSNWCVDIERDKHEVLYRVLIEYLGDSIDSIQYSRLKNDNLDNSEKEWIDKVPNIKMFDKIESIIDIIDEHVKDNNLRFPWFNIKNDLHACNIFLSWHRISIRPLIPPTLLHEPFRNSKQRIYMSATLGLSGELERIVGVKKIKRLPVVNKWDEKGLGRRFFLFPEVSFDTEKILELLLRANDIVPRSVILVPDGNSVKEIIKILREETDKEIFTINDIENSKTDFINSDNAIAVLANRYDGIDFPDEQCKMLNILGLPTQTHLQEKFFTTRMAAAVMFKERIKTRIIQAVGRCTRSDVDYSAVLIFDEKFQKELITPNKLKEFHPELQAEIKFGLKQSENRDDIGELLELINAFIEHGDQWKRAERVIINNRDSIIEANNPNPDADDFDKLLKSSKYEVEYQYALIRKDYEYALSQIEKVIEILQGETLKGYKGFWSYLGGYVTYLLFQDTNEKIYFERSKQYLKDAALNAKSVTWFNKLIQKSDVDDDDNDDFSLDIIERIEEQILKDGTYSNNKFENRSHEILQLLKSDDGKKFELGHKLLGDLLGYISDNGNGDGDPDPWWVINDNICVVSEDKIFKDGNKPIPISHVRQACSHNNWIREKIDILNDEATILTIMITNSSSIDESAAIHAKDIYYVNRDQFVNWAIDSIELIRKLRGIFIGEGNLVWRAKAIATLKDAKKTPKDFLEFIKMKRLCDITKV